MALSLGKNQVKKNRPESFGSINEMNIPRRIPKKLSFGICHVRVMEAPLL